MQSIAVIVSWIENNHEDIYSIDVYPRHEIQTAYSLFLRLIEEELEQYDVDVDLRPQILKLAQTNQCWVSANKQILLKENHVQFGRRLPERKNISCPTCRTRTKFRSISYDVEQNWNGVLRKYNIPNLRVPYCYECDEPVFTIQVDQQVNRALMQYLKLPQAIIIDKC